MRPSVLLGLLLFACSEPAPPAPVVAETDAPEDNALDDVKRAFFNETAAELGEPVFWAHDGGEEGVLEPGELMVYWGPWDSDLKVYESGGAFTPRLRDLYDAIAHLKTVGHNDDFDEFPDERKRRRALRKELAKGRLTLLSADLSGLGASETLMLEHLVEAARGIETLHALQLGTQLMLTGLESMEPASRMVLARNQSPRCLVNNDPACIAAEAGPPPVGLYPAKAQVGGGWCDALVVESPHVMEPFVVGRYDQDGALEAVPYSEAWPDQMGAVATSLDAAAAAAPMQEQALSAYLTAAAGAFRSNDWFAADRAWAAMSQDNSAWYLRVGPDETYWEPCNRHAGFHMSLARYDRSSETWRVKLEPVKAQMEAAVAALAGPPYVAREVGFDLPEFISIVLNAGDSRMGTGATIGQSLPNWGPVAEAGGRTVAMTNTDIDADSQAARRRIASSLLCEPVMEHYSDDPGPLLMSTILHEAAHNLGPSHEYAVRGQTDEQAFGGPLASTLEELKAQTSALYLTDWLVTQGVITETEARRAHTADLVWSFKKIAMGFQTPSGGRSAYPQLAAVNIGALIDVGALGWKAEQPAANGKDVGCLAVDFEVLPAAIQQIEGMVLHVKAQADAEGAVNLVDPYVVNARLQPLWDLITERVGRERVPAFIYAPWPSSD